MVKFLLKSIIFRMAASSSTSSSSSVVPSSSKMSEDSQIAQKTWIMENNIETLSATDEIFKYDRKRQQDMIAAKPWEKE